MIGRVVVMEPADYQAWLSRDSRRRRSGGAGGAASMRRRRPPRARRCSSRRPASPAISRRAARSARRWSASSASAVKLQDGSDGRRRRRLPARVDPQSAGEGRRRLPAGHADVPGPARRGAGLQLIEYIKSLEAARRGWPAAASPTAAARTTQPPAIIARPPWTQTAPRTQLSERRLRRPLVAAAPSTTSASRSST